MGWAPSHFTLRRRQDSQENALFLRMPSAAGLLSGGIVAMIYHYGSTKMEEMNGRTLMSRRDERWGTSGIYIYTLVESGVK
jgi:hypothetical protein